MNRKQAVAVGIAVVTIALAFMYTPFYNDGGIIGGSTYSPFPMGSSSLKFSFSAPPFVCELSYVVLSLWAAWMALRCGARHRQRVCLLVGLAIETVVFGWLLPGFAAILSPEFTWILLNMLAVMLLVLILLLGRGEDNITTTETA